MSKRYWEAKELPQNLLDAVEEAALDWVSGNVVESLNDCWENAVAWVKIEEGAVLLEVGGPEKPTDEDPTGRDDIFTLKVDVLAELEEWINENEWGDPDKQREHVRERAAVLRKLSEDIAALADRATGAR